MWKRPRAPSIARLQFAPNSPATRAHALELLLTSDEGLFPVSIFMLKATRAHALDWYHMHIRCLRWIRSWSCIVVSSCLRSWVVSDVLWWIKYECLCCLTWWIWWSLRCLLYLKCDEVFDYTCEECVALMICYVVVMLYWWCLIVNCNCWITCLVILFCESHPFCLKMLLFVWVTCR